MLRGAMEKCSIGRCPNFAKYRVRMVWKDSTLDVEGLGDPIAVCESHARQIRRTVSDVVWVDDPPPEVPTRT